MDSKTTSIGGSMDNLDPGSMFIKSMDVSEIVKDANMLFKVLDEMVEEVGEENVEIVNDCKIKSLLDPCAAHCIDLMLEDIGDISKVKNALKKCMFMNDYIYNHISLVNMMRRFKKQRNLHRSAVTRFATSFIALAQFHKQRNNLRKINYQEWNESKWPKEMRGKIWHPTFYKTPFKGMYSTLKLIENG
ncbi:hypothetical protein F3Y22_tig00111096pilonHSYRG00123 [Hibiscus syriacus]|uniref:DUF659 domain-containing protein n=1 Tax=Hibiscus syriacus TaxID=106335 RepID=A0A6A2Z181_HIBSY|nr:hypothetical protein F3Y22_tig00111096pilonHSYRG00123 [Hibiscus syriacus]